MHAPLLRNQFQIASILWVTGCVAAVARLASALELALCFYLTPLAVALTGAIAGRYIRRPVLGAVAAISTFTLYVLTIPLLEEVAAKGIWPFTTFRVFECYSFPFYLWAESVEWPWPYFYIWCTFCDMVPSTACGLLLASFAAAGYISSKVDRKLKASNNGVNSSTQLNC